MQIISVCRQIFNCVLVIAAISYVIMGFKELVSKEEADTKKDVELAKDEKRYDIVQTVIAILAVVVFVLIIIYGISNKKFLWLFILLVIPSGLDRIAHVLLSIGVVGNVVKTNDEGVLSYKEHTAIFLISSMILMLQQIECFEHILDFVTSTGSIIKSDMLSLLVYVVSLFVYFFLICAMIPLLTSLGIKISKKIISGIPGKDKMRKVGNFFVERIEKPINQPTITISFLNRINGCKTIIKIISIPIVLVTVVIDINLFMLKVICSFMGTSVGNLVIIYRIIKRTVKKLLRMILNLSDKKIVAISFRIAIIAALVVVVIMNRYHTIVKNVEDSTAVLEFVASSIIIPVVFEWINSSKKNFDVK